MNTRSLRHAPQSKLGAISVGAGVLAVTLGTVVALPAMAAPGDGYLTIHKESLSEDIDQSFDFTIDPGTGTARQVSLNDHTSVALNVNVGDLAASRDADGTTLWAASMAGVGGPAGNIYHRDAGSSTWVQVPQLSGTRVAAAADPSHVFVMNDAGATFWDGTSALALGAPTGCTPSDIASNGTSVLLACADGTLNVYTGSFAGAGTAADWRQITDAPRAVLVDVNANNRVITYGGTFSTNAPAGANTVTVFDLNPTTNAVSGAMVTSKYDVTDVAVAPDNEYYLASLRVSRSTDGTSWTQEEQSRNTQRITAASAGRLWASNARGVSTDPVALGTTIFGRAADGSYYDDERISTAGGPGNTVHLAVAAGTHTITEAAVPNWTLQSVSCFDASTGGNKPIKPTITNGSVSVDVPAGTHVSCVFLNVNTENSTVVSSTCQAPYVDTFGDGTPGAITQLPTGRTTYHVNPGEVGFTNDGYAAIVTRAQDGGYWGPADFTDHSGTGTGNFMYFNASYNPGIFYQERFTQAVVGTPYTFSTYIADMAPQFGIRPNVTLQVVDPATGQVLASKDTGDITQNPVQWQKYSFTFVPTQSDFLLQLVNNSVGGDGNDLGIDDVTFGISCAPVTLTKALAGARPADTDQYTLEIRSGAVDGPVLATTTTTGTGTTVTDGSVTTTQPIDTTVYLVEKAAGTTDPSAYLPARVTCVDPTGNTAGLPTNQVFDAPLALTPGKEAEISCTVTNTPKDPSLSIVKTALAPRTYAKAGDTVDYEFVVTNTGNQALTDVTVTDRQVAPALDAQLSAISCPATQLAVGAKMTCTATYTATQADVDHTLITDVAYAEGTPEGGTKPVRSNEDDETVHAEPVIVPTTPVQPPTSVKPPTVPPTALVVTGADAPWTALGIGALLTLAGGAIVFGRRKARKA